MTRRRGVDGARGGLALGALVFGAGIGALATEIAASRLLAPYFGSSTIVWANLIGIVLAALAVGYWLGGKLADRRPEPSLLGFVVLAAAVFVAAIPFVAKPLLDLTVDGLDEASAGAVIGSFLGVLLLCAPPVVLLGMVSPFAIRLAVTGIETAGAVAGQKNSPGMDVEPLTGLRHGVGDARFGGQDGVGGFAPAGDVGERLGCIL